MNISDPIADMLTRVRNASRARHTEVVVPASRTKREIARILKAEGFIAEVTEEQAGPSHVLRLTLRYVDVFVWRDNRWQCVSSQSTKVTAQ